MWRFTSPLLHSMGFDTLNECPVGAVLREAPHTFDLMRAHAHVDAAGLDVMRQPKYMQDALALCAGEAARLRELRAIDDQSQRDAKHGARVLRGR